MHPLVMDAATTDWITAVATALAAPVAAVGVVVAAIQLRGQRRAAEAQLRTTKAEFLLALDDTFRAHRRTHRKFRPPSDTERLPQDDPEGAVGIWWGPRARGPETDGDWVDVEAYMGLFERVNVMINGGLN